MFTEFLHVRQEEGGRRRWFEAEGMELIVWFDRLGVIEGFQLCYDWNDRNWALTWRPKVGFVHDLVRTGDTTPLKNQTPILEPRGSAPWAELLARFEENRATLETELAEFVSRRLAEGAAKRGPSA